jgi:Ca2+/Na+ antiporter
MNKKNRLTMYYLIVLLGVIFTIIGIITAVYFFDTVSELDKTIQSRIYLYAGLTLLFIFNGYRILSKFYKDKIEGK